MNEGIAGSAEHPVDETPDAAAIEHPDFDPEFYVEAYTDIDPSLVDPAQHYRDHGYAEGRFGSETELAEAVAVVKASGRFDVAWYRRTYGVKSRPIEDYLLRETDLGRAPNPTFDRRFFADYYAQTIPQRERPFVAYCRFADYLWCRDSAKAFESDAEMIAASPLFDDAYFREACGGLEGDVDGAIYYLTEGARRGLNPSKRFSTRGYLMLYPDIAKAELNPLVHYVRYGEKEGRFRLGEDQVRRRPGIVEMRPERATVMIACHEGSLSGAPVVGLNLARILSQSYNVVSVLLRDGPLTDAFAKASHEVVIPGDTLAHMVNSLEMLADRFDIACAVLNSVECTKMIPMLVEKQIPTVSLIHEFAQYVFPFDLFSRALTLSDVAIFPSKLVEQHARQELRDRGVPDGDLVNVRIRPQGRPMVPVLKSAHSVDMALAPRRLKKEIARRSAQGRPFVVLGAGWVQPRKGVDLFVDVARQLIKEMGVHAMFVWVGPNYHPRTDTVMSVYLADQISKSGLDDHVVFFDEQPDLRPFYEESDAFLLSSRLDPYPNVAVEAIAEGKHIVCFEGATGIADLARWPESVTAVPYNDLRAAAQKLADLARATKDRSVRALPADLQRQLSFDDYARDIAAAVEEARGRMRARLQSRRDLLAGPEFDERLFERSLPKWVLYEDGGKRSPQALADFAALLLANAMPIGLVRPGRSTSGPADWSIANITSSDLNGDHDAKELEYKAHVAFAETSEDIAAVADLVFGTPSIRALMIVSETIEKDDLFMVERVLGGAALTVVAPSAPDVAGRVGEFLAGAPAESIVGVSFRTSSHAPQSDSRVATFHHACKAALPADVFLLSALLLAPDASFLVGGKAGSGVPAETARQAVAHHLVDCRRLWLRPSPAAAAAQARFVGTLAKLGSDVRSADVWQALAAPDGLLASGRWAYIEATPKTTDEERPSSRERRQPLRVVALA